MGLCPQVDEGCDAAAGLILAWIIHASVGWDEQTPCSGGPSIAGRLRMENTPVDHRLSGLRRPTMQFAILSHPGLRKNGVVGSRLALVKAAGFVPLYPVFGSHKEVERWKRWTRGNKHYRN